ncbi:MAG: hypothetical protein HKO66_07080 [Saprospiraceae bacterium]|nr:hypothetical protein [Saprospiraceae bacterium]
MKYLTVSIFVVILVACLSQKGEESIKDNSVENKEVDVDKDNSEFITHEIKYQNGDFVLAHSTVSKTHIPNNLDLKKIAKIVENGNGQLVQIVALDETGLNIFSDIFFVNHNTDKYCDESENEQSLLSKENESIIEFHIPRRVAEKIFSIAIKNIAVINGIPEIEKFPKKFSKDDLESLQVLEV